MFDAKFLYNAVVKIEPPTKHNGIVQCYRCQQFGHTKTSFSMYKEWECTPQYSNYLKAHTASYKG